MSNIKVPVMPEPQGKTWEYDQWGHGKYEPTGQFTADQIAARDAQWLEMAGPVVEALQELSALEADGKHASESSIEYWERARAALSAITEPAPQRARSTLKLGQQTSHLDAEDTWLSGDDMMGSSG